MKRYVLRFRATGKPADLDIVHSTPGLKIVDASSPHMLLVEATDEGVRQLKDTSSWDVSAEAFVPVPDTRKKVRQPS